MKYIKREIEKTVLRYLQAFPVVGITGPRQSGKSTLLQHMFKNYTYVTFDDHRNVGYLEEDPDGFMQQYSNRIIFDEVQNVPSLFNLIKLYVDRDRQNYGKFILTGSSQFSFLRQVSESLAGRIGLLSLLPFQYKEMPRKLLNQSIYKGSYPELVMRDYRDNDIWFASYFDTYLNKDVRVLSNIGDIRDFQRFISLLATNVTQILDMSNYARDLGVSVPTIKRWVSVLEASYIIFLLPPFYKNYGKRIVKRPKIYFCDTGLVSHLVKISTKEQYENGPMAGSIFENHVVSEILKKELHQKSLAELFYLRTSHGVEVDLIIDRKQKKELIEIKKISTFKIKMADGIKQFLEPQDQGFLLYNGEDYSYKDNIKVINYTSYLK